MRAIMGVAFVEMIDDSFKPTTEITSNVTKLNDTMLKIHETLFNFNDTTQFPIIGNYNETDIESNKLEENNTVANSTESKVFKGNGFYNALLLTPPVSGNSSIAGRLNLKELFS